MVTHCLDETTRKPAACEACNLLNRAIGDLVASARLFELTQRWESLTPAPSQAIRVSGEMILQILVVIIYWLEEVREQLIAGWLLSEEELKNLGFH